MWKIHKRGEGEHVGGCVLSTLCIAMKLIMTPTSSVEQRRREPSNGTLSWSLSPGGVRPWQAAEGQPVEPASAGAEERL